MPIQARFSGADPPNDPQQLPSPADQPGPPPVPQVDYRNNPSFGQAALPLGGPSYDQPIEPAATVVPSMQDRTFVWDDYSDQHYNRLSGDQGTLPIGYSPDEQRMLSWERSHYGRD